MKMLGYPELLIEVLERRYKGSPRLGSVKNLIKPLPSTRDSDGKVDFKLPKWILPSLPQTIKYPGRPSFWG